MNENSEKKIDPLLSYFVHHPVILVEVGKRIEEIRVSMGQQEGKKKLGLVEFGQKLGGYSHTSVGRWEDGEVLPDSETLLKIVNLDPRKRGVVWLLGGDKALQTTSKVSETPAPFGAGEGSEYEHVAALDCDVAAGPGQDTKITTSDKHALNVRWVAMSKQSLSAPAEFYRWMRVHGDSMEPAYPDKSWVLVNLLRHDPHKHKLIDKPVVVWLDRDKGCTLKILQESADERDFWILHAFNLKPRPIKKNAEHIQFAAVEAAWRKVA